MPAQTYVDVHIIQTVPPSNLNRDDSGAPKQAVYGGTRRARVSSQAWKRATRKAFTEAQDRAQEATRTQRLPRILTDEVAARTGGDRAVVERVVNAVLDPLGVTKGKREAETAYLLFLGRSQVDRLATEISERFGELSSLEGKALEASAKEIDAAAVLSTGHPLAVALFGRMVADLASLNVDAAVQVAHAISTHAVSTEFDYFTAVDDEKDRSHGDDVGAGMIGTVEFNSSTLYRYATIGLHLLVDNLGGSREDAVAGVKQFIRAFATSIPSGHQSSFAHRTLPEALIVAIRDDQPVNLVSAFEAPVGSQPGGYANASIEGLARRLTETGQLWGSMPSRVLAVYRASANQTGVVEEAFGPAMSLDQLIEDVGLALEPETVPT